MLNLDVPYLSYDYIRNRATEFLTRYDPSGSLPVPIEEIVELKLKLDIIPLPGLKPSHDIDAFITSNVESIFVDLYIFERRLNRYRFSLAHELAHAVLHAKIFRKLGFTDLESWRRQQDEISRDEYGRLEFQANAFAGLILVPSADLKREFQSVIALACKAGVSTINLSDDAKCMPAGKIARSFEVSTDVIIRRLEYEKLWESGTGNSILV